MQRSVLSLTGLLCGLTVLLFMGFGAANENLIFITQASTHGWTWLSAHFTHISTEHLIWNVAALLILGLILESYSKTYLVLSILIGIVTVNLYLGTGYSLDAYAGLSGILNCLFVSAVYLIYRFEPNMRTNCRLFLILGLAKIIVEWLGDTSLFTSLIWQTVPQAHLAGYLGGIIFALLHWAIVQFRYGKITSYYRHS